jgi:C-terminal processing protease CtpA/Prc
MTRTRSSIPQGCSLLALLLALGCRSTPPSSPPTEAVAAAVPTTNAEELRAFTKLYGYVRFFHPSDEAAAADWERVAVEGARRVVEGSTRAELVVALREVFEPLAPTLRVYPESEPPPAAEPPRDGPVLAWQHLGFGFGTDRSAYDSARLGRPRRVPDEDRSEESSAELFGERPKVGETFTRSLGAGLACRVVLGLPLTEPPAASPVAPAAIQLGAEDPAVRVAAVVVAWNVLQHFYPYHDVTGEDWDAVLDDALADVLDDEGPRDLALTLRRLVHRLHDGHGSVSGPGVDDGTIPLHLAQVEGRTVVLAAPEGLGVARGDELLRVDGVAIEELMAQRRALESGSPQWVDHTLLAWGGVTEGPAGTTAAVELRHDGEVRTLELARVDTAPPDEPERPSIDVLEHGVLYVDLDRATPAEIMARMAEIAAAPGVVLDMRGYPNGMPSWLPHLLAEPDTKKWMFVPHIIRPDFEGEITFAEYGWGMQPAQPHIAGKVAFISGPGTISYAESLTGYIEGYRLGAIVGAPTAGANGNIAPFTVPGGYTIVFTGMKVTRMDGRQHHIVGVQPTHPVQRTLAGILAGRDEELEAALALVRPATPPKTDPPRKSKRRSRGAAR